MQEFFQEKMQKAPETLGEKETLYHEFLSYSHSNLDFDSFHYCLHLFLQEKQGKIKLKSLEDERLTRKRIMDEHLHNCKNVTFPKIMYQVAKELSRGESLREKRMAQDLMYAYAAQMRMETDTKLLKLKLETMESGDFVHEFRRFLGDKKGATMEYLLRESLMLTMFRILMTEEEVLDGEEYALSQEKTMEELRQSFWSETIHAKPGEFNIINWFSEEIYPFHVNMGESWQTVYFMQQGCAFVYMAQILTNLMINALNYGKKSKQGCINLEFQEEMREGRWFFSIKMTNPVEKESSFLQSTGYGIESVKVAVARLNQELDVERYTRIEDGVDSFVLQLFIEKKTLEMEG